MKNLTDIHNNSQENKKEQTIFDSENGNQIAVSFDFAIDKVKYSNLYRYHSSEGWDSKVQIKMESGSTSIQYRPNDSTNVYAVIFSKEKEFKAYSTRKVAVQETDYRDEYKVIEIPFGKLERVEDFINNYKLGNYESYYYAVTDFVNNDFKVIKEEVIEEDSEFVDYSNLGLGIEFERGCGFNKTSKDNFYVGTFWFKTETERNAEFELCNKFYSNFKEEKNNSNEDEELIWNRIFTNGLTYDMI